MRTKLIILFFTLLYNLQLFAQFKNEYLSYDLKFGFLKGGEANFTACDTIINNNYRFYIKLHGFTLGLADLLYDVDNKYESFVNSVDFLPYKINKNLHEQNYRFYDEVKFYNESDSAYSLKLGWQKVESGMCDVVSMMYHLRFSGKLDGLKINDIISIPFWDTNNWYVLKMQFKGVESIKTNRGRQQCLRIEPLMKPSKLFHEGNPINIWFTNDYSKIPVLMELNFKVGSVKCELKEIRTS